MKNKFFMVLGACFITMCLVKNANAQSNYNTGAGVRLGGYENGLTLKHFISSNTALEGIVGFRPGAFVVTGLYEKHETAFAEPSLNWFYGFGAHIGGIDGNRTYRGYGNDEYYVNSGLILGADGIAGLEWTVTEIPLALSLDLHPRLELARGPFLNLEFAFTARYTF